MRQRVMIAMALAAEPGDPDRRRADHRARRDGPGADPRTHAQAQAEFGTSIILITHDMGVVAEMADRVVVMTRTSFPAASGSASASRAR
jgi:peptide/nickel transport system ATP-binding protein